MLKLNLGEDDSASYSYNSRKDPAMVGEVLEARYGLYSGFFQVCGPEIAGYFEAAMAKRLDSLLSRDDVSRAILEEVGAKVEDRFRLFLESYEAEQILAGSDRFPVPTRAALEGTGKNPNARGSRRQSFIDTGLLKDSFRAWLTEQ